MLGGKLSLLGIESQHSGGGGGWAPLHLLGLCLSLFLSLFLLRGREGLMESDGFVFVRRVLSSSFLREERRKDTHEF